MIIDQKYFFTPMINDDNLCCVSISFYHNQLIAELTTDYYNNGNLILIVAIKWDIYGFYQVNFTNGQQEICNWFLNFEMHQSETTCRDEKGVQGQHVIGRLTFTTNQKD